MKSGAAARNPWQDLMEGCLSFAGQKQWVEDKKSLQKRALVLKEARRVRSKSSIERGSLHLRSRLRGGFLQ